MVVVLYIRQANASPSSAREHREVVPHDFALLTANKTTVFLTGLSRGKHPSSGVPTGSNFK